MKIVMTATNPVTNDPRIIKEAKALNEAGHKITIVAWDRDCKNPSEITPEGIEIIRIPVKASYGGMKDFIKNLPLFYKKAYKILKKMDFDAIHTHDFDTAFLGYILKKQGKKSKEKNKRIKWVYDIHDLYFTFLETEGKTTSLKKDILKKIIIKMDLAYVSYADNVITVSENIGFKHDGLKEFYTNKGIDDDKFTIIWNSPDIKSFSSYEKISLKKSDKFTIGFIGGLRTVDNFKKLFKMTLEYNYSDKFKFLIVGKGHKIDEIKKYAEKYGIDVEFTGQIDYNVIPNYYKICDIIYACYPMRENIRRAMPLKVLESQYMGIPVVVNKNTLFEDYTLSNNMGVSIDIDNEKDYLKIFEYLINDEFKNNNTSNNTNNTINTSNNTSNKFKNNVKNEISEKYVINYWDFQKNALKNLYASFKTREQ
ncbi:glycosyltransferase involved in cell wall biosynthesis [Methanococcus voltae]|uniref:glycosyltransferase n=1 Tax=Methanococcus voltae TaxID=2188 RepID=UPI001AE3B530|nr:glycosyltransferase [Methanococcus voltae]MBP2143474.1 glycosyltransferase involved in cell wall biosynthesis [Methanococcus voltae]